MSDDIFYVEKILDVKIVKGEKKYLIKWEGYGPEDNSWEPEVNLNAQMLKEFENKRKKLLGRPDTENETNANSLKKLLQQEKKHDKALADNPDKVKDKHSPKLAKNENTTQHKSALTKPKENEQKEYVSENGKETKENEKQSKVESIKFFTIHQNKLHLIVQFANSKFLKLVPYDFMRKNFPQQVIDFYEKNATWDN